MQNFLPHLAAFDPVLFFGRFHILVLHLPIGMLLLLAAFEVAVRFKRFKPMAPARGFIIGLAAISAAVTAGLGWLLATAGGLQCRPVVLAPLAGHRGGGAGAGGVGRVGLAQAGYLLSIDGRRRGGHGHRRPLWRVHV